MVGSLPIIGLMNAPDPVEEVTLILGRSVISTLFIGIADIISPLSIVKLYSVFPSVATAST